MPCVACRAQLVPSPHVLTVPHAASTIAVFAYDGDLRELILALKYANRRDTVAFLAGALVAQVDGSHASSVISWVPTTRSRRRRRGFDQSEVLARAVGRRLGRPVRALLRREGDEAQTGRGAAERRVGPHFDAPARRVAGKRILLIDDVITSGATAAAAVAALTVAGAAEVHVRAVAATPLRRAA